MAFLRYANAAIVKPLIQLDDWIGMQGGPKALTRTAATTVLQKYDPNEFLLTHCTIIASVDTEESNAPHGRQMVDGYQIDRQYSDWLVTPDTQKYINNNNDCWERKLLLSSFKSFVGGENYVEHVQIPELSKGKIIDAASRDIGDSIYVDILVATAKKHRSLIAAIESKRLSTLSMGCFLPDSRVTLEDGRRIPIRDVAPGDMVLTHRGRAREVLNHQIRLGRWNMRRIEVVGVPDALAATDNHPIFALRPARTCACGCSEPLPDTLAKTGKIADPVRRMGRRFKRGHDKRVYNPNACYSLEEARNRQASLENFKTLKLEEVRADALQVGDYLAIPRSKVTQGTDPGTAKARLLGYFLAEGSFLKHKGKLSEVQFNFSLEEKGTLVADTVSLLQEAFPGSAPWVQDREDRNTCTVHCTGSELVDWFKHHGGEYSHRKHLSLDVLGWSVESHLNLLGAWLDGDGTRHSGGSCIGTTTSYDLVCQLQLLAVRCGLPVRMECTYGGVASTIAEAVVNGESLRHPETGKLAAFNLCFSMETSEALRAVTAKAPTARKLDRHLRVLDDMVIFPITRIEPFQYEGDVHDLEVEEDHSYQVEGVAVHNCSVAFTICTRCGNVAEDEAQMCPHIKYAKGNEWIDELGKKRKISELCGHFSAEPGSVKFIEASWVANPAFKGAVLRSILTAEDVAQISKSTGTRMQVAFNAPVRTADPNQLQRAANFRNPARYPRQVVLAQDEFDMGQAGVEPAAPATPAEKPDPLGKAVDSLVEAIREKAIEKVRGELGTDEVKRIHDTKENTNNTLVKEAARNPEWLRIAKVVASNVPKTAATKILSGLMLHKNGGWRSVVASQRFDGREMLVVSRLLDVLSGKPRIAGESRIYRTVMVVGGPSSYPTIGRFLQACRDQIQRPLTDHESRLLVQKGRIYELGTR